MSLRKELSKIEHIKKSYFVFRKLRFIIKSFFLNKKVINRYFKENKIRKLHVACGERKIKGWLNSDIYNGDIYLNATKNFSFKPNSFDYIYSHQFIEHIPLKTGINFLMQIKKVLKKGGKVRIVTPDMKRLIMLYQNPDKKLIKWYCKNSLFVHPLEFINEELRQNREHIYIYDFDFLKMILEKIGFRNVKEFSYGKSLDKNFDKIDLHGWFGVDKISLCVEAEK